MPDAHDAQNPGSTRLPPVPAQMVYAVRGSDRISGDAVETVIEAPDADAARRIADQKSLEVVSIALMHPLNGAEALRAAKADPRDRFNQPGTISQLSPVAEAPATRAAPTAPTPAVESPSPRSLAPAVAGQRPIGFSGPQQNDTRAQRPVIPGSVAAALVLAGVGGLLYFNVVRAQPDGAMADVFAASPHRAAAVVDSSDQSAGPTDVDRLIKASQDPASAPILPRAQRGPGQTAYRVPPAPRPPAASPVRVERAEPVQPLVLTALSRGGKGKRAVAVINGEVLCPGQSIGGHSLIQILDDSVVLERDGHLVGLGLTPQPSANASPRNP